ncbi:MAG TPA: adenosylcobinamide-GDP ribazoletransferase [Burkholderiaceae bacterium]|nr:adenosylcobinamide-GDP ribazoletransferase [Burkholderiaceae bacterium]
MIRELRLFLIALQFMTRVPVPRWVGFEDEWLSRSARHFAGVGVLVGGFGAGVLWAAAQAWPMPVAVGLSMAATVWLTGAFHEDGFADTCDGLGGAVTRERALEIMKDSRIGAYGAIGVVMMLGLKAATLATLPLASALPALALGHTASRAAATVLMALLPYAGDAAHAKARPLARQVGAVELVGAMLWVAVLCIGLWALDAVGAPALGIALAGAAIATTACARWLRRRLGGFTGDTLGATQQITELALLLGVSATLQLGLA